MRNRARAGLALDLGTSAFRVATRERVLVDEASVIARDASGAPVAVGSDAHSFATRRGHRVLRPIERAELSDRAACVDTLALLFDRLSVRPKTRPGTVLTFSLCTSPTNREDMAEVVQEAWGGGSVTLVAAPRAAAVGAGVPTDSRIRALVVDVGRGATECAILNQTHIEASAAAPIGGDDIDAALCRHLADTYGMTVDAQTVERMKISVSAAADGRAHVTGLDATTGIKRTRVVSAQEVAAAADSVTSTIVSTVSNVIDDVAPAVRAELRRRDLHLTGAGSQFVGLAAQLGDATGMRVRHATTPVRAVIDGARAMLAVV